MKIFNSFTMMILMAIFFSCGIEDQSIEVLPVDQFIAKTLAGTAVTQLTESVELYERAQIIEVVRQTSKPNTTNNEAYDLSEQVNLIQLADRVSALRAVVANIIKNANNEYSESEVMMVKEAINARISTSFLNQGEVHRLMNSLTPNSTPTKTSCIADFSEAWADCTRWTVGPNESPDYEDEVCHDEAIEDYENCY